MLPYMDDNSISTKRRQITKRGLSGLCNIGNTCYMNSILQCLSSSDMLRSYLFHIYSNVDEGESHPNQLRINIINKMAKEYRQNNNLSDDARVGLHSSDVNDRCKYTVTYQIQTMFKAMWKCNRDIEPRTFKKVVGRINTEFAGYNQNDSQELLNLILDELHEELGLKKRNIRFSHIPNLAKLQKQCKEIMETGSPEQKRLIKEQYDRYVEEHPTEEIVLQSFVYWKKFVAKKYSVITELFTGLYCSQIQCGRCNFVSTTFDPFTMISVPVPNTQRTTLNQCFQKFTEKESLDGQYTCKKCQIKVDATKSMVVWQPPEILVVHLKRFKNNGYHVSKIHTNVEFPLNGLNLTDLYSKNNLHNFTYNLYAVSNHHGSYNGGHYTAYCKNSINNKWYKFDDETVCHIPLEYVKDRVSNDAYILFYERTHS